MCVCVSVYTELVDPLWNENIFSSIVGLEFWIFDSHEVVELHAYSSFFIQIVISFCGKFIPILITTSYKDKKWNVCKAWDH